MNIKQYTLDNLICGRITPGTTCNVLGKTIADNLIRVAATQIFTNRRRAFVELVVNSIDATRKRLGINRTVGKFGFGFFSILDWIIQDHRNKLVIESNYLEGQEIKSYRATIEYGNELTVSLERIDVKQLNNTPNLQLGTNIILFLSESFEETDLGIDVDSEIRKYLFDIRDIPIYITHYQEEKLWINERSDISNLSVDIIFSEDNTVSIRDQGIGISEELLLGTLLVPSISTKGIENMGIGIYENHTRIEKEDYHEISEFIITVNDITIVEYDIMSMVSDDIHYLEYNYKYILSMPPDTSVPLARDDIILRGHNIKIFYSNLLLLIDLAINQLDDLTELWIGLNEYIINSSSESNKNIIKDIMRDTENRNDILFVPIRDNLYSSLGAFLNIKLVVLPNCDITKTENYILTNFSKHINSNIYWGKNVIIMEGLKGIKITSGGMATLIFVDKDYILSNPNWTTNLSMSYNQDRLYPYNAENILTLKQSEILFVKEDEKIAPYYEQIQLIYLAMLGSLSNFPNTKFSDIFAVIIAEIKVYVNSFNHGNMLIYLRSLYYLFNNVKPNISYGVDPIFFITAPVGNVYSNRLEDKLNQDRDLAMILWINNIAMKSKSIYSRSISLRRISNIRRSPKLISSFCDQNKCSVDEELILRELNYTDINSLEYSLREIRSRYSPEFIHKVFVDYIFYSYESIHKIIINPLNIALDIYQTYSKDIQSSEVTILEYLTDSNINFTGKQLFNSIFKGNIVDFSAVSKESKETLFQIFEIAINEGTTKDYIPAILSELTQNSIDAMRNNNIIDHINLGYNEKGQYLYFQDYVGIHPNNLVYLLVPFLSNKTHNDITTGEMGTGFFNLYRQPYCKSVLIQTIKDEIQTTVFCRPIISNNRVIDINYTIYTRRNIEKSSGTLIIIYLQNITLDIFVDISLFVHNSLISTDYAIVFNDKRLQTKNTIIHDDKFITISYNEDLLSQILTNGTPFNLLHNYPLINDLIKSLVPTSLILNMKKPYYKITQSRTSVTSVSYTFNDYLILGILYLITMDYYPTHILNRLLPFLKSPTSYDQLKLSYYSDINTLEMMLRQININEVLYPSIKDYINNIIDKMYPKPPTWSNIRNSIVITTNVHPIIMNVITLWFKNKLTPTVEEIIPISLTSEVMISINILQHFIAIYWELGFHLQTQEIITGTKFNLSPPILEISALKSAKGMYIADTHKIILKEIDKSLLEIVQQLTLIQNLDDKILMLRENPVLSQYFNVTIPLNTFLHEITHAFINKSEHEGSHDAISLGISGLTKSYAFDEAGATITRLLIQEGLLSKFTELIK